MKIGELRIMSLGCVLDVYKSEQDIEDYIELSPWELLNSGDVMMVLSEPKTRKANIRLLTKFGPMWADPHSVTMKST